MLDVFVIFGQLFDIFSYLSVIWGLFAFIIAKRFAYKFRVSYCTNHFSTTTMEHLQACQMTSFTSSKTNSTKNCSGRRVLDCQMPCSQIQSGVKNLHKFLQLWKEPSAGYGKIGFFSLCYTRLKCLNGCRVYK